MNNEELKELAAVLNGIADGKKWEFQGLSEIWTEGWLSHNNPARLFVDGWRIRLKQWQLPDPPQGYEWHRTDWTEEMLPEGWRPQYVGEIGAKYECSVDGKNWQPGALEDTPMPKTNASYCRTNAPLPPSKPQLREVELCADDVKAGDEFLSPDGSRFQWTSARDSGVVIGGVKTTFSDLMNLGYKIRSVRETEWRKCSKMEEVPV